MKKFWSLLVEFVKFYLSKVAVGIGLILVGTIYLIMSVDAFQDPIQIAERSQEFRTVIGITIVSNGFAAIALGALQTPPKKDKVFELEEKIDNLYKLVELLVEEKHAEEKHAKVSENHTGEKMQLLNLTDENQISEEIEFPTVEEDQILIHEQS